MNTQIISHDNDQDIQSLLIGRRIVTAQDDLLTLDDGTTVRLVGSEGCGGCANGHTDLDQVTAHDNIITSAVVTEEDAENYSNVFRLFVYTNYIATEVATFTGSDLSGYYGLGFTLHVQKA